VRAYVFPLPSGYAQQFPAWAARQGLRFDATTVDGQYVIFRMHAGSG
jgi:hypothetical protein